MRLTESKESVSQQGDCIYYVYEHIADGAVFYVGKGTKGTYRCKEGSGRNSEWNAVADAATVLEYRIVAWREDEADALSMERQVWLSHKNSGNSLLTNKAEPKNHIIYRERKVEVEKRVEVVPEGYTSPAKLEKLRELWDTDSFEFNKLRDIAEYQRGMIEYYRELDKYHRAVINKFKTRFTALIDKYLDVEFEVPDKPVKPLPYEEKHFNDLPF